MLKGASIFSFLNYGEGDGQNAKVDAVSFEQVTLIQETVSIQFITGMRLIFL